MLVWNGGNETEVRRQLQDCRAENIDEIIREVHQRTQARAAQVTGEQVEAEEPGSGSEADIDLSTADPDALGLDALDDDDAKLINAIEVAKHKKNVAASALPEFPALLKQIPNWIQWKLEDINGRPSKVPYVAGTNRHASSTDCSTWTDFQTAINGVTPSETSGVGFVIHGVATEQQIVGFDLDGCRNPETGDLTSWAEEIIDGLDSYCEVTPSQYGARVWVRGVLPGADRVFNLDPAIGFGTKVKIEVFTSGRYFTVTGDALFEGLGVEARDLTKVYELCHEIRRKHPAKATPKAEAASSSVSSSPVRVVTEPGSFSVDKLTVLMIGTIKSTQPFVIEDGRGNSLEYASHSEADLALATCLAIKHGDNPEIISAEFRTSPLFSPDRRNKWERLEEQTIQKAIKTAKEIAGKSDQMVIPAVSVSSAAPERFLNDVIPEFDRGCVTGIYKKVVDLVCEGTTIPPQFAFLAAKVFIGARMAGKVTFENLDADSSYYGTVIAETGTGKGLAWRRTVEGVFQTANILENGVKIIYSADSGAGLKDTFFEPPEDQPVICYIDEVTSLGHKAGEKKNPEIIDTIIELADSNRISRVLASRKGQKANRTSNNARLSLYVCGQNGDVFMSSFAGRTKLGIYDRLYPEYSPTVEAGDLPDVDQARARELWAELNRMKMSGRMKMAESTKSRLDAFWKSQPTEIRKKPRFKKHLMLDMYMAAFGRGVMTAEPEDLESAVKLFNRQIVIRTVHFTTEVPDRVGLYISRLKAIFEKMRRRLNAGEIIAQVAMSERDFQTDTLAYKENDLQSFNTAWRNFSAHVAKTAVTGKNGHTYQKFIPEPNEDEVWVP